VGYGWPWTVRPGETIDFMVSADPQTSYRADLVRIICGDNLSDPAMFKEKELAAAFSGDYPGRRQSIHAGSYVEIAAQACLDELQSFTVQAMVFPTALPRSAPKAPANLSPPSIQHLVSRWDQSVRSGWGLLLDAAGRPAFLIGDGQTAHQTTLAAELVENHWFFVMASYDAIRGLTRIHARPMLRAPSELLSWPDVGTQERVPPGLTPLQRGPLRFAASMGGPGNRSRLKPVSVFNGRLDRVRLCTGALDLEQGIALAAAQIPDSLLSRVLGFWDFGAGIDTIDVFDRSGHGLRGVTVNLPTRAVAGVAWDGSTNDWRQRPDHYSAIHFHDDDLYDAEWEKDFSFTIPEALPSGIYAARLRQADSEDYIPFFVAPSRGVATAPLALLLSTSSYTAYANWPWDVLWKRRVRSDTGEWHTVPKDPFPTVLRRAEDVEFVANQLRDRRLGKGVYLHHTDGSLCNTASQKYPNFSIKPKTQNYTLVADTYLTDWLEHSGVAYDIITDDLLQREGVELLKRYTVVMTSNHPEYCSAQMLAAISAYQHSGGRWMYLGGNGFFWVTSYHSQLAGAVEVRKDVLYPGIHPPHERHHAFDGQSGGLWSHNARPAQLLMGVGPVLPLPFERSAAYERLPGSYDPRAAFIFAGVEATVFGDYGIIGGGAAGQETDEIDYALGTPHHALHLARSQDFPGPLSGPDGMTAEEYRDNVRMPRADLVFFEAPQGGAVFSVGSMAWVGALGHNHYANDVAQITGNVLRRFLDPTPFRL